jgi:hypothetical protein
MVPLVKKMNRTITLTRRVTIGIIAVSACAVLVAGSLLANFIVPSTVHITSQPGIVVLDANGATITSFNFGDVQQTQQVTTAPYSIKNSGGSVPMYIIDQTVGGAGTHVSLSSQGLPTGTVLTWNIASVASSPIGSGCAGVNYPCIEMFPGSATPQLTLTLSASTSAIPGTYSFTVEFDAFSTNAG